MYIWYIAGVEFVVIIFLKMDNLGDEVETGKMEMHCFVA